jgi:hypothetical protein
MVVVLLGDDNVETSEEAAKEEVIPSSLSSSSSSFLDDIFSFYIQVALEEGLATLFSAQSLAHATIEAPICLACIIVSEVLV